ncbi:hypothetical protein ES703_51228 [subsurface metagenome]
MALWAIFSDLAPVQTIFPELNMRVAVLGLFSLKTRPGNFLGLYSTFLKTFMMERRSNFWSRDATATTFCIWTSISLIGVHSEMDASQDNSYPQELFGSVDLA